MLRDHRPLSEDRFRAEMEVGDLLVARGRFSEARQVYATAVQASAASSPLLSDAFKVRLAWADYRSGDVSQAKRTLEALLSKPASPSLATAAGLLRARIARDEGDQSRSDQLLAQIQAQPTETPLLLSQADAPATVIDPRAINTDAFAKVAAASEVGPGDMTNLKWVDIGYWIRPNGRVDEPEILRGSRDRGWAKPLLSWVASRRYAQLQRPTGDPGSFHVERFTQTAEFITPAGSNIRRRAGRSSVVATEIGH